MFLSRFLLNARTFIAQAVTSQVFGRSLEGAAQNRERGSKLRTENQVAGGDIDGFRCNVNGSATERGCQITVYEFVIATHYHQR